jgi:AcrR family transcriptional regulator
VARRKLSDVSHPDPLLTDEFWLEFGDDPQPPMRLKILYVTFGEVANSGPGSFNVASVCDRLGITYPMVNHYFGSRDGLLAEGAYMVYERYVERLWDAVMAAPRNPEARLKAWMMAQITETLIMGGWGPILNYPLAAREVTAEIDAKFQKPLNRVFELNLARLAILVRDVRKDTVTDIAYTAKKYPRTQLLTDPYLLSVMPTVSWSIFGMSVWVAGEHAPARNIKEISSLVKVLLETHFRTIVSIIRNHPDN